MDNVCHTLVGAACGEAGLKHRTRFGNVTLMIAANLPDLDVLSFFTDTNPISFRRGWTHGVVAQLVLPVAFTGVMYAIGRLRPRPDDIERIEVATYRFASVMRNPSPHNYFASKYSFPHAAAVMVVRGHAGYRAIDDSALHDPQRPALQFQRHARSCA